MEQKLTMTAIEASSEMHEESVTLLMKIQAAGKDWDGAPEELSELRQLLSDGGCDMSWTPKKLGINLLTANKLRATVLKKVLMKLYPFENFWMTETLDETLQKCLLVCQQLGIESERSIIWGLCSMDDSYQFWKRVLGVLLRMNESNRREEDCIQEAKSSVISALMSSRGTDWDKQIAKNFENGLGRNKLPVLVSSYSNLATSVGGRPSSVGGRPSSVPNTNWRASFQHVFQRSGPDSDERAVTAENRNPESSSSSSLPLTTTSFALKLRHESEDMIESLRNIEKYYSDDCVLQIDNAFELGYNVCELAEEFETYMTTNNRGAFRDIESLINHTDKVIRSVSKISMTYQDFIVEFQKYFGSGRGDEININLPLYRTTTDVQIKENK